MPEATPIAKVDAATAHRVGARGRQGRALSAGGRALPGSGSRPV